MKYHHPGWLLLALSVLTIGALITSLVIQSWVMFGILLPMAVAHGTMLLGYRPGAYLLLAVYGLGIAASLFNIATFAFGTPFEWRPITKLLFNAGIMYELFQWLGRQQAVEVE